VNRPPSIKAEVVRQDLATDSTTSADKAPDTHIGGISFLQVLQAK
jgi:hypothetical protein